MKYLLAFGEIFLKGKNRGFFEKTLIKNIKEKSLKKLRNRYIIETKNPKRLKNIFGLIFYTPVKISSIKGAGESCLSLIKNEKSFRITTKRSDKRLEKTSMQFNEEFADHILKKKKLKVNLTNPEINIIVELINGNAYIYREKNKVKCRGGLPVGVTGKVFVEVNDKIRSCTAGYQMMKRGCEIILSKRIPRLEKYAEIKIRKRKDSDIVVSDETLKTFRKRKKQTLRPLIAFTEDEIESIYKTI